MASDGETDGTRTQIIHLATGNPHKAREMQALADAARLPLRIVPAATMPLVDENTGTFVGNARKKALALRATLPPASWVLADDSGLCVDALGGGPGVESAYFAGAQGDGAANLRKLADVMREVPEGRRGAHFVCVLVLLGFSGGADLTVEGRCHGVLRHEPAGGQGFGYDPLFVPAGYVETYAELGDVVKNKISHRARAWLELAERLRSNGPMAGLADNG